MDVSAENNLSYNSMSKIRIKNTKYLNTLGRNARGDAVEKVNEVIKLYRESKVSQISTAENMIIDLIYNKKNQRQQKATTKKYEKFITKHQANAPLNKQITQKKEIKNKSASKIIKLYRNGLKFEIVDIQVAFKDKVKEITVKPSFIGSAMATDLDAFVAKSYIIARRKIPKDTEFKLYATLSVKDNNEQRHLITTKTFTSKELNKFLDNFLDLIKQFIQSNAIVNLSTLRFTYNFAIIPSGGGVGTPCREIEAVYEKKSVIKIVNDDNNCFWYCLAILFDINNKSLKDNRNKALRIKAGKDICNKSKCRWDNKVSVLEIPLVEETYNCNIYIIDAHNIPMLGTSVSLLLKVCGYKSENRNANHYFLLFDEVLGHYDCITDIKKFLGLREFCYTCLKGFSCKESYENHKCCTEIMHRNHGEDDPRMLKELGHYLESEYTKGSSLEIVNTKSKKRQMEIKCPKYIIYDFETDTSTDIHKPNHVEIEILKIDDKLTHDYDLCLKKSLNFNGYGCETKFCDWLFTKDNRDSTVIAHNGAGYDNKFILQYCLNKGLMPSSFIRQGSRITYMSFKSFHIRIIDSYHFFLQPLKKYQALII